MTNDSVPEPEGARPSREERNGLNRRELLRGAMAGGTLLATGGLLAACGSGSDSGAVTGSATTTAAKLRAGGNLRVGVAGGGAQDTIDAHVPISDPDVARVYQLYEPLAIRNEQFELEMVLAESIEAGDAPDVWTVRLRDGVTFHDGKPLTADDVLFSLQRILDPKRPGRGAAAIGYVDLKRSKKLDDRTVKIALRGPNVAFPDDLGQYFNGIVPVGYDPKHPVGTGPFKYRSFSPGQQSVFVKNADYWRSGEPHVDQVTIIDFADDTARISALLGGQVDAITNLSGGQIAQVQSNPQTKALVSETGAWQPFTMRVDQAPFDDVRVRQAFRLLVDREQMVAQALNGQGRIANDLYAPYDSAYASDLPQRHVDVEQAKSLLRAAGRSGLTVELTTSPVYQGIVPAAQVLAEQAKAAGVTINVKRVDSSSFYGPNYLKYPFAQDFWFTRNYLQQVSQSVLPTAPYNETHWSDPQYVKLIGDARRELDEGKRRDLLHQAQQLEYDRGGYIVFAFSNQVDGYSTKVSGFTPSKVGVPLTNYGFRKAGFVA